MDGHPTPHRREEHHREDLLAEATALVERIELGVEGLSPSVVVGFRSGGDASVYFDQDPAYHFNSAGELRRAYAAGKLYKASGRRLVALARQRDESAVHLVRHELSAAEEAAFLGRAEREMDCLAEALAAGRFEIRGQVPADRPIVERVKTWLAALPRPIQMATAPNAGRNR